MKSTSSQSRNAGPSAARRTRMAVAALSLTLLTATEARSQSGGLAPSTALSPATREIVRKRMATHADSMSRLIWDVMFLLYDAAAKEASTIAEMSRPLDRNDPRLQDLIHVFDMQERLRYRALGVVDAARAHDGAALGTAFGQLSETCVQCHVAYLNAPRAK